LKTHPTVIKRIFMMRMIRIIT